jgi:hypothetical protein
VLDKNIFYGSISPLWPPLKPHDSLSVCNIWEIILFVSGHVSGVDPEQGGRETHHHLRADVCRGSESGTHAQESRAHGNTPPWTDESGKGSKQAMSFSLTDVN